jgi:hypothetical protein
MLKRTMCASIFIAAVALSACTQVSPASTPLGSTSLAQPSHRAKPAATSVSVTIQNTYGSEIIHEAQSSQCLSGSPPTDVAADSTSSPFAVSYPGSCTSDVSYFDMTYGPDGAAADTCIFKINYSTITATFSFGVTNNSDTTCSYQSTTPGTVTFIFAHS